MKKIRTIVFDFGGVISKRQNKRIVAEMCKIINVSPQIFFSFYTTERKKYDSGLMNARTYWKKTIHRMGGHNETKDIDKLIVLDTRSWLDINAEMIKYIKTVKDHIKLAILSNMTFESLEEIKNLDWISYFKQKIFSCLEKVSKPDKEIYLICLKKVKAAPQEVLFIDDVQENLDAAHRLGINTLKFINCRNMKKIIKNEFVFKK